MDLIEAETEDAHDLLDRAPGRHERQTVHIQVALYRAGLIPACLLILRCHHLLDPHP